MWTEAELLDLIAALKAAILALAGGVRSYSINTGHGSQSVTRESLPELQKSIAFYQDELERMRGRADFVSIQT